MANLALFLLGQPRIELDGSELKLKRKKAMALLAYLASTNRRHTRDSLAELLYPELDRERAYSDFRQLLSVLRSSLGDGWLEADRESVGFPEREGLRVDLWEFSGLVAAARTHEAEAEPLLLKAAELARGPFLSGFSLKDSTAFEDWQEAEAERIRRDEASVLERLVQSHESRNEHEKAIELCRKLLALDPVEEGVHRRLMRLYAGAGKRAAALAQYERCKAILAREVGEKPSRETETLRAEIAAGRAKAVAKPLATPAPAIPRGVVADYAFVGREREMARLRGATEQATAGNGRLVVLAGEAGIGKTRAIEEAAAYAEGRGARVLWGTSHEDMGTPAYWPWRQILGRLVREAGPEEVRQWAGRRASVLAEIVQEIPEALGELPKPPPLGDQESERFRICEAVDLFLHHASESRPLVLVLDDLHWADRASLKLLEFAARGLARARILILCAIRDAALAPGSELAAVLGEMGRMRWFERLDLGALDRGQVAQMAESSRGSDTSNPADLLWEKTRGNPLFVVEYLRSLAGATVTDAANASIPPNVCAVINRRMNHLERACLDVLEVAAAFGAEFTVPVISRALDVEERRAFMLLDMALGAKIVVEVPGVEGSFRFSHPLIRECLASALGGGRRAEVHARLVSVLETLYGDKSDEHATEISHHCALGQPEVASGKLSHYSLLAGEQALGSSMYEEALGRFRRGLAAKGTGVEDAETAWLLFGLARSLCPLPSAHEPIVWVEDNRNAAEALGALTDAFEYFSRVGDSASAIRVAAHPFVLWNRLRGEIHALFERGLALAAPGSVDEARLLWLKGRMVDIWGAKDPGAVIQALRRSLSLAATYADTDLRRRIIIGWAIYFSYAEPLDQAAESVRRAIPLLAEVDDPRAEIRVRMRAYHVATGAGHLPTARGEVVLAYAVAERLRDPFYYKLALLLDTELESAVGNWDAARTSNDRAIAEGTDDELLWQHIGRRALLEIEVGQRAAADGWLGRYQAGHLGFEYGMDSRSAVAARVYAWTYRLCGEGMYLGLAQKAARSFNRGHGHEMGVDAAALIAAFTDDRETARVLRADIAGRQQMWLFERRSCCLGLLDMTLGDTDSAVSNFDNAIEHFRTGGMRPLLAWTCSDCAEALLRRGTPEDKPRAAAYLKEAGSIARTLGMVPLGKRIRLLGSKT